MLSRDNKENISTYLTKKKYFNLYIFLKISLANIENRSNFIKKEIKELENKIKKAEELDKNKDGLTQHDTKVVDIFRDIHYRVLEIIAKINIFIELLAVYYNLIRKDIRKLPTSIGQKDFDRNKLYDEFKYFNKQKIENILTNFKYPNVKIFNKLSQKEQIDLEKLLKKSAEEILKYFKDIYKFQKNFRSIYNKYKHTPSEFTGQYEYKRGRSEITSEIYVRSKEKNKKYTYIIPVGFEIKEYFKEIEKKVSYILSVLIDNILLFIINRERDCIPRNIKFKKEDGLKYKKIKEKIKSYITPDNFIRNGREIMIIPVLNNKALNKLKDDYIYKKEGDIFEIN